jgi:AraC-like DNA-binding protein
MELTLSNGNLLEFQNGLPANFSGPVLLGAASYQAKSNLTELVIQELKEDSYSIRYILGRFLKKIDARGWIHSSGIYSNFMLKGDARKHIHSIGKLHIRENQFVCFYAEESTCSAVFDKNKEFRILDLFFSPTLLEEIYPYFDGLKQLVEESNGHIFPGIPGWCLPSMQEIIGQILHCPFDEPTRKFYFDLKVRELLLQMLDFSYKSARYKVVYSPADSFRIHQARDILADYVDRKPPALKWLCKQVGLNQFKLKHGFRQYFHLNMFDWLFDRKMVRAKELLLTTDRPIKEIAALVGYPRTTNFTTAFRRKFGMTPGSLRR